MPLTTEEAALLDIKLETNAFCIGKLTKPMQDALFHLVKNTRYSKVQLLWSFDLPEDWLEFRLHSKDGTIVLVGGISPEGSIHT